MAGAGLFLIPDSHRPVVVDGFLGKKLRPLANMVFPVVQTTLGQPKPRPTPWEVAVSITAGGTKSSNLGHLVSVGIGFRRWGFRSSG